MCGLGSWVLCEAFLSLLFYVCLMQAVGAAFCMERVLLFVRLGPL